MRTRLLLLALAVSAVVARAGPVACIAQSLNLYEALGSGGCTIGLFTFKDFQFSVDSSGGGANPIASSAVTVYPSWSAAGPAVGFSSFGSVSGTQWVIYTLSYNIDPPPVIIRGFDEEMTFESPHYPGWAQIDTDLCVGGVFTTYPTCTSPTTATITIYHKDTDGIQASGSAAFSPLVNMLGVYHLIELNGGGLGGGGTADFSGLVNETQVVPEPAAWLLVGCGLLALPFLRRRAA